MENKQTTLPQTLDLKLDFFPSSMQSTLNPARRLPVQLVTSSENVQCSAQQCRDFVQCDCVCR
jgi:hypothetical protein